MFSKQDIEHEIGKGINVYPLHTVNIKENSVNFTIGKNAWTLSEGKVIGIGNGECQIAKSSDPKNRIHGHSVKFYISDIRQISRMVQFSAHVWA